MVWQDSLLHIDSQITRQKKNVSLYSCSARDIKNICCGSFRSTEWACIQAGSVVSMAKQDEKHFLTSSSSSFKEPARLDGVALVKWTNLQ